MADLAHTDAGQRTGETMDVDVDVDVESDAMSDSGSSSSASSSSLADDSSGDDELMDNWEDTIEEPPVDPQDPLEWPSSTPAPAALSQRYNDAGKLLATASPLIRDGLNLAHSIIDLATGFDIFLEPATRFCEVALAFLLKLARRHTATAARKRDRPASAERVLLLSIVNIMRRFANDAGDLYAEDHADELLVEMEADEAESCIVDLKEAIRATMGKCGMLRPSQLKALRSEELLPIATFPAVRAWFKTILAKTKDVVRSGQHGASRSDWKFLSAVLPLLCDMNIKPKLVPDDEDDTDDDHEFPLAHSYLDSITNADEDEQRFRENERDLLLDMNRYVDSITGDAEFFQGASATESIRKRIVDVADNARTVELLSQRSAITVLQYLLIALCQTGYFSEAVAYAELAALILREAFDDFPTSELRRRAAGAAGALTLILRKAKQPMRALIAASESAQLVEPLSREIDNPDILHFLRQTANMHVEMAICIVESETQNKFYLSLGSQSAREAMKYLRPLAAKMPLYTSLRQELAAALHVYAQLQMKMPRKRKLCVRNLEEAANLYREVLKRSTGRYTKLDLVKVLNSLCDLLTDQPERAIETAREAIKMHESLTFFVLQNGRGLLEGLYAFLGRQLAAVHEWEAAYAAFKKCYQPFRRLNDIVLRLRVELMLERYHDASETFQQGASKFSELSDPEGNFNGLAYIVHGAIAFGALCGYRKLLSGDPTAALTLFAPLNTLVFENNTTQVANILQSGVSATGWSSGAHCALGNNDEAIRHGEKATSLARQYLAGVKTIEDWTTGRLELARMLVFLAVSLCQAGRHAEGKATLEESLAIMEGTKIEGSTRKTALLLHAELLEGSGQESDARAVRRDAEAIPYTGFLHRLRPTTDAVGGQP